MAEIKDFEVPDFLTGYSANEVRQKIMDNITDKLDKSEGSILWDLTDSTALVLAEVIEYVCVELIRNMFPMWADGKILDYHGQNRGLARKPAVKAVGTVLFTGKDGIEIAKGTKVTTTAIDNTDSVVIFETVESVTIASGVAVVDVRAVSAGIEGNVAAGRIDRLDVPDEDVESVTNEEPTYGGLDEETDDDYRQRLVDADDAHGVSYIGSVSDYKRWAMSINGVGNAIVTPSDDGSGLVTIVVTDVDGNAASEDICEDVYNYIMRPDNPLERLAPINTILSVVSPSTSKVTISANVLLDGTVTKDGVISKFVEALNAYYPEAVEEGYIRYNKVAAILINVGGVDDFSNLTINGGTENIIVTSDELPVTEIGDVALAEVAT